MNPYPYTVEQYHASIPVSEYLDKYVDVETFLNACKACHNYGKVWSCPSYESHPGSISLSAGSCHRCKNGCTRTQEKPCRFPEKMRYSIESLGGNVGLTIEKLMGIKLEWIEEGKLSHHFVLVCGLLIP